VDRLGGYMKHIKIAIDGPSGSGKSTIAKIIAKNNNIVYLDTGAMYRTFALYAIRNGVDTKDWEALEKLLPDFKIEIKYINREQKVFMSDEDVTGLIRTNEISLGASDVSAVPAVRIRLVELQRKIAEGTSVVMDGRDIGTYVLPDADVKIFLTASPKERAHRRYLELKARDALTQKDGTVITEQQIKEDIIMRDKNDSEREFAPLKQAEDAILVDTTGMTIKQVTEAINDIIWK